MSTPVGAAAATPDIVVPSAVVDGRPRPPPVTVLTLDADMNMTRFTPKHVLALADKKTAYWAGFGTMPGVYLPATIAASYAAAYSGPAYTSQWYLTAVMNGISASVFAVPVLQSPVAEALCADFVNATSLMVGHVTMARDGLKVEYLDADAVCIHRHPDPLTSDILARIRIIHVTSFVSTQMICMGLSAMTLSGHMTVDTACPTMDYMTAQLASSGDAGVRRILNAGRTRANIRLLIEFYNAQHKAVHDVLVRRGGAAAAAPPPPVLQTVVAEAGASIAPTPTPTPTPAPTSAGKTAHAEKSVAKIVTSLGSTFESAMRAGIAQFFKRAQPMTPAAMHPHLMEARYDALAHSFGDAETKMGDEATTSSMRGPSATALAHTFKRAREAAEDAVRGAKRARMCALNKQMGELLDEGNAPETD